MCKVLPLLLGTVEYCTVFECESRGKSQHIPTNKAGKAYKQAKHKTSKQASKQVKQGRACSVHPHPNKQARAWHSRMSTPPLYSMRHDHLRRHVDIAQDLDILQILVDIQIQYTFDTPKMCICGALTSGRYGWDQPLIHQRW